MSKEFNEARRKMCWSAAKAAGAALIPFSIVRIPTLTGITSDMANGIMRAYGYESLEGPANFMSVALGACAGVTLANEILERFPGIGTAAASASTASLHLITGAFLITACEMMRSGAVTDSDLRDNALCKTLCQDWLKKAGDILIKILRGGNPAETAYPR